MNGLRRGAIALLLAAAAGCAAGGGPAGEGGETAAPRERRDMSVIGAEEMRRSGASNAYEAVERLRPLWLRSRRERTPRGSPPVILVYLNNARLGGTDALRRLEVRSITSIRYLDAAAATALPGTGSLRVEGAIVVSTTPERP